MKRLACCILLTLLFLACPGLAQDQPGQSYEQPSTLSASRILPPQLLSGPNHHVEETVRNDGYMNIYKVRSRYGDYRIVSTSLLATRIDEFAAMHAMDKANGAKEYGKGVWEGGVSLVEGVKNLVTAPVDTLGAAASGVGKLFTRTGESINGTKASKYEDSTGSKLTGFAAYRREYALAFGVDPYSTNERLQEKLRSVTAPGYAGGLTSMGLKALIPGGVGIAVSSVSGVSWLHQVDLAQPPQDLRIQNRKTLASIRVVEQSSLAFMDNDEFTPTQQSLLVKALADMGKPGGADTFVRLAARTENQDQALFRQRMAQMYAGYHRKVDAVRGFVRLGAMPGVLTNGNRLALCLPVDHLCWTKDVAKLAGWLEGAAEKFQPSAVELWVAGTVSVQARKAVSERKWVLRERAGKELLGEKIWEDPSGSPAVPERYAASTAETDASIKKGAQ